MNTAAKQQALEHYSQQAEFAADHRDAQRYRWLRNGPSGFVVRCNIGHDWELLAEDDLDAAIDAARAAITKATD